ncbi:MAG: IPT/TIG domain-containing protein, partial [Acidobacteriota bacterium]|nr:IPT/TIG domain-containing protein [Acidobacteriota bacterium]
VLIGCAVQSASVSVNASSIAITIAPPVCVPQGVDLLLTGFDLPVDLGRFPAGVFEVVAAFRGDSTAVSNATLVVQDAAPPFIVSPNVSAFAGDEVAITGKNLISCGSGTIPPACEQPIVKFGDATATVVSVTPDHIVVRVPSLSPKPMDVTIDRSGNVLRSAGAFYFVPKVGPANPAFFEPILFPVAFTGPGALGSQWHTQIYLRNENEYPVTILPLSLFNGSCALYECYMLPPARSTQTTAVISPKGLLAFIPRQAGPNVHFGVLVRDLSRQSEALGTEIPVLREKDLFNAVFELLNVPTDPRFRVALRVYDIDSEAFAYVKIYSMDSDDALVSTSMQSTVFNPGYVQISDLVATFPRLAGKGPLRIKIDPGVVGGPHSLWGFASVTNNVTQHVTTIAPQ